jgi:hypothetical protein
LDVRVISFSPLFYQSHAVRLFITAATVMATIHALLLPVRQKPIKPERILKAKTI